MANNELSSVTFRTNLNLMSIICFIAIIVAFVTSSTSANTAVNLQGGDKLTDEQLKVLLGNKRLIDEGMMPAVVYLDVNGNDEFNAGDAMYAEKRNDESGKRSDESNMPGVLRFGKRAQSFIRFGRAMKKDMPG